jgi:hypothetical protein
MAKPVLTPRTKTSKPVLGPELHRSRSETIANLSRHATSEIRGQPVVNGWEEPASSQHAAGTKSGPILRKGSSIPLKLPFPPEHFPPPRWPSFLLMRRLSESCVLFGQFAVLGSLETGGVREGGSHAKSGAGLTPSCGASRWTHVQIA